MEAYSGWWVPSGHGSWLILIRKGWVTWEVTLLCYQEWVYLLLALLVYAALPGREANFGLFSLVMEHTS